MTDIEGSTKAWNAAPKLAKEALHRHDEIVTDQVERHHGQTVEAGREGDSVLAVFRQASDAVTCGLEMQRALARENWPAGIEIGVRIAIHTGEAELTGGHYVGAAVYRCARLMATAHGGQVLVSGTSEEIVADSLPDGAALRDLGEHWLRDFSRPMRVFQLTHVDLPAAFPPLKSAVKEQTNTPQPLTTFVGRRSELNEVVKLVSAVRVVTLTGPGGVGKSRLAMEIANHTLGRWPDGVWWIDLSRIDDPKLVGGEVVTGLHLQGGGAAEEVLAAWLVNKNSLLILDNCEHVLAGCSELVSQILDRCRAVTVLATSREPLGVKGEARWTVSPLELGDALALFEQRGRLVLPTFSLTASNKDDVAEICGRVDGIPLAIELAASGLGVMSERDISRQLLSRFDLFSGRRSNPPRHQTIVAAIDWSYRLLSAEEAALFGRLAVFRGGFSLEAAVAVCADATVPDPIASLIALTEKSMVLAERLTGGEVRYRLMEAQASYAEEKLKAAKDFERSQRRHYDYFSAGLIARTPAISGTTLDGTGSKGVGASNWKRLEYGNLWAALRWAREHEREMGLTMAACVALIPSGDSELIHSWLTDLLGASPERGRPRMQALGAASVLALRRGDLDAQLRLAQELETMARQLGDREQLIRGLHAATVVYQEIGELDKAEMAINEALNLNSQAPDLRLQSTLQNDLGILELHRGHFEVARRILSECIASLKVHDEVSPQGAIVESLGSAELGAGDQLAAESSFREALRLCWDLQDHWQVVGCLGSLARSASARGDHARAVRLGGAHHRLSRELSYGEQTWWLQQLEHSLAISRNVLGPMRSDEAWRQGNDMGLDRAVTYALEQSQPQTSDFRPLTKREAEVAALVRSGLANAEIGTRLFLSERTVEGHLDRIRTKLGVRSRAEVAAWAAERGIESPAK